MLFNSIGAIFVSVTFYTRSTCGDGSNRTLKNLQSFYANMLGGLEYCLEISGAKPYIDENLDSISEWVDIERIRLIEIYKSINFEPQLA